jgi:hypothetical protein
MGASRAERGARLGRIGAAAAAACLLALAAIGPWGAPPPAPLAPGRAEIAARRAEAAFADAQAVWAERIAAETGRAHQPARLRHFARAIEAPCAGGALAAGPVYCAADGTLAMDLATVDALALRLRWDAEAGVALFVGRAAAAHAAAALGLDGGGVRARAEAADCLTGYWARRAEARLGPVEPSLYGRTLVAAREAAVAAAAPGARLVDRALFARGARGGREAAFARGLAATSLADCG